MPGNTPRIDLTTIFGARQLEDFHHQMRRGQRGARRILCGAISQYNNTEPVKEPANYLSLLVNRARMTWTVVFGYADRHREAMREMVGWMAAGKPRSREDIVPRVDTFPETLLKLFSGGNLGKLVLKAADL